MLSDVSAEALIQRPIPLSLDNTGRPVEMAAVVDLDRRSWTVSETAAFAHHARVSNVLLIGIAPEPDSVPPEALGALDLTLTGSGDDRERKTITPTDFGSSVETDLKRITATIMANPQAALVAAELLRAGTGDILTDLRGESRAYSLLQAGEEFARWRAAYTPEPIDDASAEPVLLEVRSDQVTVTLNRPMARNAMDYRLRFALLDALKVAAEYPDLPVMLTGRGRNFSTGGDLSEFGTFPDPVRSHLIRGTQSIAAEAHGLHDRLFAQVTGACLGSGIEIAAFASHVVADRRAFFALPEISLGLIPGAGGTVSIPRRIGRWRTLYLLLSGRSISSSVAAKWGLIDEAITALRASRVI